MISLTSCSGKDEAVEKKKVETVPEELAALAAKFKEKAGSDRKKLAEQIQALMPACTGTADKNGFVTVDYTKPTYYITIGKIRELMGNPNEMDGDLLVYNIANDGRTRWELVVEQREGYIISAKIDAGFIKKR